MNNATFTFFAVFFCIFFEIVAVLYSFFFLSNFFSLNNHAHENFAAFFLISEFFWWEIIKFCTKFPLPGAYFVPPGMLLS